MRKYLTNPFAYVAGACALTVLLWVGLVFAQVVQFASIPCTAAISVPTGTETAVCAVTGVSLRASQVAHVLGWVNYTPGTGTSAMLLRVRRGTTTVGVSVSPTYTIQVVATSPSSEQIAVEDNPGEVAGQQYVLTVQPINASAAGTASSAEVIVLGW